MSFRVPSLRNAEYTAPYGSFGQFSTLREVLDYFDNGVLEADNLDPILKNNGNRIPLTEQEKDRKSTRLNLQSRPHLVCRLLLEKKKKTNIRQKTVHKRT